MKDLWRRLSWARWFLLLVVSFVGHFVEPARATTGNPNPTLAYNLGGTADWVRGMQFLDIAKMMRPWIGHKPGQWGGVSYQELRDNGYLDAQGWVKRIPESVSHVGTLWQWSGQPDFAPHRTGIYDLTYEGTGALSIGGDANILERAPGHITFENRMGENIYLNVTQTDPEGTGDYIRNIQIIPQKYAELFALGGRFNPNWLALIADSRVVRFMDWNSTNNSEITTWSERGVPAGLFTKRGKPVEYMVQLANEIGADPWFTMPHRADETYIRNFARYVRDRLDPALTIRVEYSNETWNWAFQQAKWIDAEAKSDWPGSPNARHDYHTKKAVEVALIWNDVFGDAADQRLRHVLATQATNTWATKQRLEAREWSQKEPSVFIKPADVFNELAVTHYFGSATVRKPDLRAALIAAIQDPEIDAQAYLAARLMDPAYPGSIPAKNKVLQQQATLAARHGLRLVAYEGGQHVHQAFAIHDLSDANADILTGFMHSFVRSKAMADLYRASWQSWAEVSSGPFMQFTDISQPSKWGAWGLRESLGDNTPRAVLLDELNAMTVPWWPAKGGAHYQQGITARGGDGDDFITGTAQEDYLIGAAGDDQFSPGLGNDGVHGGAGYDLVIFSSVINTYAFYKSGSGGVVVGPDGRNLLIEVEAVQFADTQVLDFTDVLNGAPFDRP